MKLRWPLACSIAISVFTVIDNFVAVPLNRAGIAQSITSWIDAVGSVLRLPGGFVARAGPYSDYRETIAAWVAIIAVDLVFYWLVFAILFQLARRPKAQAPREGVTRRDMLAYAVRGGVVLAAGVGGYSLLVESRWLRVSRRTISIRGLPASLNGFTIAQMSDVHHGPWLSLGYVRDAVARANSLNADLITLIGDYVHRSPKYIAPVVGELAKLRASSGVVAVLGNHDWWESGPTCQEEFARAGIPLIDNTRRFVTTDRKLAAQATEGLCIAGVGDLWTDEQRYDDALGNLPAEMPRLLLAHNPDTAEETPFIDGGHRVDLMLSGHTHGGQIRVPGFGTPVVPSKFGQKYASGLVQGPTCPVLISHGVGMAVLPLRFGVPPEIILIELRSS